VIEVHDLHKSFGDVHALRVEPLAPLNVIVSVATTLAAGMALVLVAIRLYQRERILFG
jgi:hypothetical protein